MLAVRIHETGGPEKLRIDDIPVPTPGAGELRLRVEAAGLNYIDTYKRGGLYAVTLPHTLGGEAAGIVTAVGAGVTDFKVGDHVASAAVLGAYAVEALAPAAATVKAPAGVSSQLAAAVLLQGMTAHFLACDTWPLEPGDTALVHAAAGGVGLLLVQIAKKRGARVLGTVGSDAKVEFARAAGADEVIVLGDEVKFPEAAKKFTSGRGVDVVYDGIGKVTFEGSLESLRPRGLMVSYGNASGSVPPFAPLLLAQKGALYLTRPTLPYYIATPSELQKRSGDLFTWIADGSLKVRIGATFPMTEAASAHRALEGRTTTGKVLLLPQ